MNINRPKGGLYMSPSKKSKFKWFNTISWTIIAMLLIYISNIGENVMATVNKDKKECMSVKKGNELMACYFSLNYMTNNEEFFISDSAAKSEETDERMDGKKDKITKVIATKSPKVENEKVNELLENREYEYLKNHFYIVDSSTSVTSSLLDPDKLIKRDVSIKKDKTKPQILIYHTHSSEKYCDSEDGNVDDTVVGVGEYLTSLLEEKGYNVMHDLSSYDVIDGKWNRNAYETALVSLENIMKENPSIQVTIDLHRNSGEEKAVTTINDKKTAQIMFFNGVSRTRTGKRSYLENKNLSSNLAFSLQAQLMGLETYPGLCKNIYIKGYRYNLHIAKRSMLIEVGNDKNTVEEAKNAMIPFSDILTRILEGEKVTD